MADKNNNTTRVLQESVEDDKKDELVTKPGRGGKRAGAGRPRKKDREMQELSAKADKFDPAKTLKELGYDPLVGSYQLLREIDLKIKEFRRQPKPSQPAIAALLATKAKVTDSMLRYGYRPVPEKTISENVEIPLSIGLTERKLEDEGIQRVMPEVKTTDENTTKH